MLYHLELCRKIADKCEVTNLKGGTYIQLVNLNRKLMDSIRQMKNLLIN